MKINSLKNVLSACFICFLASCSSVDFGEQYKKVLYIINGEGMLFVGEHEYASSDKENSIDVSVYCGSSEPIAKDITITLKLNPEALDSLNHRESLGNAVYIDKQLLPANYYTFPSQTVPIKAGSQYGVLEIPLKTEGLDADIAYALPITIESNTANYEVNKELQTLIYEVKMINDFSGDYAGSSKELPDAIRPVQPTIQALSATEVRLPIHNYTNDLLNLKTDYMVLTISADSTSVAIKPWGDAVVTDLGGSMYDTKRQYFELHYSFVDKDGSVIEVDEKIRNIDAIIDEDE